MFVELKFGKLFKQNDTLKSTENENEFAVTDETHVSNKEDENVIRKVNALETNNSANQASDVVKSFTKKSHNPVIHAET